MSFFFLFGFFMVCFLNISFFSCYVFFFPSFTVYLLYHVHHLHIQKSWLLSNHRYPLITITKKKSTNQRQDPNHCGSFILEYKQFLEHHSCKDVALDCSSKRQDRIKVSIGDPLRALPSSLHD